jgi:hypothetical protein
MRMTTQDPGWKTIRHESSRITTDNLLDLV